MNCHVQGSIKARDLLPMILIVTGALLSSIDQRINERYFALSSLLTVYTITDPIETMHMQ